MEKKNKVLKFFKATIKSVDEKNYTVDAVVSTASEDRQGDVIIPEAFKTRLQFYIDHPVLLSSHKYSGLLNQIGEAKSVGVSAEGLLVTFKYYVGQGNPEADWAFKLAQNGIAAWSIGFMGYGFDNIVDPNSQMITGRRYTDVELLEISQVLVPANRDALQLSAGARMIESELSELVTKAFDEGKLQEAPRFCECKFAEGIKQAVKIGDLCGTCDLPLTLAQKEKAKKDSMPMLICPMCHEPYDHSKQPQMDGGMANCPNCGATMDAQGNMKRDFCACKEIPRAVIVRTYQNKHVKRLCAQCQKELSQEDIKAIADFCDSISASKHYSELLFEDRAKSPLDSPEQLVNAVQLAFKK